MEFLQALWLNPTGHDGASQRVAGIWSTSHSPASATVGDGLLWISHQVYIYIYIYNIFILNINSNIYINIHIYIYICVCAVFDRIHPRFCRLEGQPNSTTMRIPHLHCVLTARFPAVVFVSIVLTVICIYIYIYLVGGLDHFLFSIIYGIILPIDFHIFQDGRLTTNQMVNSNGWYNMI